MGVNGNWNKITMDKTGATSIVPVCQPVLTCIEMTHMIRRVVGNRQY